MKQKKVMRKLGYGKRKEQKNPEQEVMQNRIMIGIFGCFISLLVCFLAFISKWFMLVGFVGFYVSLLYLSKVGKKYQ